MRHITNAERDVSVAGPAQPDLQSGSSSDDPDPTRPAPSRRVYLRAAAWLAAAWLVPAVTHLLAVDWLLPPLVLLLTAGLLRGGRTLLDRLVLATGLLIGVTTVSGLLLSVWPFGLEPVAVAGVGFTVLAGVAVGTGRRVRLPRPSIGDALTTVTAIAVVVYLMRAYLRAGTAGRLALLITGEDNIRHFSVLESVRALGGYLFLHPAEAANTYEGMRYYPQGWHLVAGLLENFLRSSSDLGDAHHALGHYLWFGLAGYGLFTLALLWAAQWIAGPLLTAWWRLPMLAFLAGICLYDDLLLRLIQGYSAEVLGLALLVLLVAVASRPVGSTSEQMILIAGLVAGIGFGYYLLLPAACLVALTWLVRNRAAAIRRRAVFACATLLVALAAVPLLLGVLIAGQGVELVQPQRGIPTSRDIVIALTAIVAAGAFTAAGRRLRVWRSYRWVLVAVLAPAAGIYIYQQVVAGGPSYYFEKALNAGFVSLLLGLGALVLLLPVPRRTPARQPRQRLAAGMPAVLLTLAVAAALGVVNHDSPYRRTIDPAAATPNWGRAWAAGSIVAPTRRQIADRVVAIDRQFPRREGTVTIVASDHWYDSYLQTVTLAILQRSSRDTAEVIYGQGRLGNIRSADELKQLLLQLPMPVRVVATSAETADIVREVQRVRPPAEVELLLPG